jgi:hypothetical protein
MTQTQIVRPWPLCTWTDASQLAAWIDREKVPQASQGVAPSQWFATLRNEGKLFEAVSFLAHALPRYECVLWATRTLIETGVLNRGDPFATAALRWIDDPSDRQRRAAGAVADESGRARAGEMLCQAVFYSGGSIAPPDLPAIQPPSHVCARMASGAVLTGAYADVAPSSAVFERAFAIGEALACGE